jgi:deoxyadenosine/deoxycytidine kinase
MYIIEGIIGAGKSTFLQMLKQRSLEFSIACEPVHNWEKHLYGQSLLTNFYQQPQRWAYTFELMTLMHRAHDYGLLQKIDSYNLFVERSLYSGHYCFAYNSFMQGFMSALEWKLYQDWFTFLVVQKCRAPQGFIYLKIDPVVAYERIKKRNRYAEKTLSLAYLKQINERHEEFLISHKHMYGPINNVPVLVLDVTHDFEHDPVYMESLVKQVQDFIFSHYISNKKSS